MLVNRVWMIENSPSLLYFRLQFLAMGFQESARALLHIYP